MVWLFVCVVNVFVVMCVCMFCVCLGSFCALMCSTCVCLFVFWGVMFYRVAVVNTLCVQSCLRVFIL